MAPETAIQPKAGIVGNCHGLTLDGSEATPAPGSRSNSNAGASTSPGSAATASATLQPKACATGPPTEKLRKPPTGTAIMNHAMARVRRAAGTRSASQLVAAGAQTASPTPTPSRVTARPA